jgi:hypothetical protein
MENLDRKYSEDTSDDLNNLPASFDKNSIQISH